MLDGEIQSSSLLLAPFPNRLIEKGRTCNLNIGPVIFCSKISHSFEK